MAGATHLDLRLLILLLLCVSFNFFSLYAIPITRIRNLQHKYNGFQVSQEISMESAASLIGRAVPERRDVELNDYPGSGANNRHSPRSQLGRGCYNIDNC